MSEEPAAAAVVKSFTGLTGAAKAAKKLSTRGKVPKSCRASNMDAAKAMGILGFSSTRWLDYSSGNTPKQELDNAHFKKMMEIHKKKRNASKEEEKPVYGSKKKVLSADDEIRILHEAYQFLLKKHKLGSTSESPRGSVSDSLVSPFMKLSSSEEKPKNYLEDTKEEPNEDEKVNLEPAEDDEDVFDNIKVELETMEVDMAPTKTESDDEEVLRSQLKLPAKPAKARKKSFHAGMKVKKR